ncbi:MAG: nickel-dependent lactate racemase [Candidatus Aminicenantes bacterium]|jgi:nickel-dependent lactate racemase
MNRKAVNLNLGHIRFPVSIPDHADVLSMGYAQPVDNPREEIQKALNQPLSCLPLKTLVQQKILASPNAKAAVVLSDNTRPVPYRGEADILSPILEVLMESGLPRKQICLLFASGTHRPMNKQELEAKIDPGVLSQRFEIIQHDCRDSSQLVSLGKTEIGGEIFINRFYMESDIKILTGLVESHFMAGVSGGRKSICPGLLGERSTQILHGGPMLSSPHARDMVLEGNPVHEEATRVAKMAGCDMIVNVTLDTNYRLTGVFAGDLEEALLQAYNRIKSYVAFPVTKKYDIILTHAGYVGVNHYQAAKGAAIGASIIKDNGICILAAHHTDQDPVGGPNYKRMMRLLGEVGTETFIQNILDPSWTFVPEQWEAQMWTRLFIKTPPENLLYCSLEIPEDAFTWLPERDARTFAPEAKTLQELVQKALDWAVARKTEQLGCAPQTAVLADGPYGIPF